MTLSLHIVTWNSGDVICNLLDSIAAQTRKPDQIIVVDNASNDATISMIEQSKLPVTLIKESTNTGFAGGHNTAIQHSQAEVMIICNPDIRLDPDTLAKIERAWKERPNAGIIIGEMRRDQDHIDCLGIERLRGFRFYNVGEGERRFSMQPHRVWGANGGFFSISRTTLKIIEDNGEYLDTAMNAYKDDVDLSWRVQRIGMEIWLDPLIRVEHARTARRTPTRFRWLSSLFSHRQHSPLVRLYSYRNHLWTIIKNAALRDLVMEFPWLMVYEIQKGVYLLITSPRILVRAWIQTFRELPRLWRFRRQAYFEKGL